MHTDFYALLIDLLSISSTFIQRFYWQIRQNSVKITVIFFGAWMTVKSLQFFWPAGMFDFLYFSEKKFFSLKIDIISKPERQIISFSIPINLRTEFSFFSNCWSYNLSFGPLEWLVFFSNNEKCMKHVFSERFCRAKSECDEILQKKIHFLFIICLKTTIIQTYSVWI